MNCASQAFEEILKEERERERENEGERHRGRDSMRGGGGEKIERGMVR